MAETNKAIKEAIAVIANARKEVEAAAEICLEQGQLIEEILKAQPIEVNGGNLVVTIKVKGSKKGGGGRKLLYEEKEFPSAKSLCDFLGIEIAGDSAIRKLEQNKISYTEI